MYSCIRTFLSCTFLSNKESRAPVVYCLLHAALLFGLIFSCPYFIDFQNYTHVIIFWFIACVTTVLYFVTHFMDPGHIPYDAVFFTDQDESSSHAQTPASSKLKPDSVRNLKGRIIFPEVQAENLFASGKTNLGEILGNSQDEQRESTSRKNGRTAESNGNIQTVDKLSTMDKNTNTGRTPSGPIQSTPEQSSPKAKEKTKDDLNAFENELNTNHENDVEIEHKSFSQEIKKKASQDVIVDCEPSFEEGEENTHDPASFNKGNSKLKSLREEDFQHDIEVNMNKIMKARTYGSLHSAQELEKTQGLSARLENRRSMLELYHRNIKNEGSLQQNITQTRSNIDGSENVDVTEDAKETQRDNKLVKPMANKVYRELEESREKPSGRTSEMNSIMKVNPFMKKNMPDTPDNERNMMFFMKKPDENIELDDIKDHKEAEPLYVERRYCTACNLEQPFRAKHCRECNRCIAQFDHHCPWLGTCIGEKNHMIFYWFLVAQAIEIVWGEFKLAEQVLKDEHNEWVSQSTFNVVLLLSMTFFLIMVIMLLLFHSYLAGKNLTTWETLSWEKISYLRDWKIEWGSPFSQGVVKNLHFFCCADKTQLQKWRLPKFKKDQEY